MSQGLIQLLGKVLQAERSEELSYEKEAREDGLRENIETARRDGTNQKKEHQPNS